MSAVLRANVSETSARSIGSEVEAPIVLDPLEQPDWDARLKPHPGASFFLGGAWARVLRETYGHRPVYLCRFSGGHLRELLPVMEVASPLTGRRGVSLPFADLCPPLGSGGLSGLYARALELGRERNWRYLECRGRFDQWSGAKASVGFFGHAIFLESAENAMFARLDDAMRRGIRKAEREKVQIEFRNDLESVRLFYALHCRTRRRHGVPPQPFRFFENLARHVLAAGSGFVALARHVGHPVAAAMFFHEGRRALYKFGASDERFQHLRPNNLLMWDVMKRCAANHFSELHLGRTSLVNEGLRRFKLGLGAVEERIEYARYDFRKNSFVTSADLAETPLNAVFRCLPLPLLRLAGKILYSHLS